MTAPDPSMTPDELRGFWKRVDERCGELGITYTQLAQATGVRSAHLAHLMHDPRPPSLRFLLRTCRHLKVSSDWLLGLDIPDLPPPRFRP